MGRRRAALLLAVLALALATASCGAQQDSREAHVQLQSAAKVSGNTVMACAASAESAGALSQH